MVNSGVLKSTAKLRANTFWAVACLRVVREIGRPFPLFPVTAGAIKALPSRPTNFLDIMHHSLQGHFLEG